MALGVFSHVSRTPTAFFFHPDTASDLDGGGAGAQAWWEAPCVDRIYNLLVGDGR